MLEATTFYCLTVTFFKKQDVRDWIHLAQDKVQWRSLENMKTLEFYERWIIYWSADWQLPSPCRIPDYIHESHIIWTIFFFKPVIYTHETTWDKMAAYGDSREIGHICQLHHQFGILFSPRTFWSDLACSLQKQCEGNSLLPNRSDKPVHLPNLTAELPVTTTLTVRNLSLNLSRHFKVCRTIGTLGLNPTRSMDLCPHLLFFCCPA
jgi:hypothetical protein